MNFKSFICRIYKYSGVAWIIDQFYPKMHTNRLPAGPLWVIGVYVSIFTIGTTLYLNKVNAIENRITVVMNHASEGHYRMFFKELRRTYGMLTPTKPQFYKFWTSFQALFGEHQIYLSGTAVLKDLLDEVRLDLDNVDLRGARLEYLDLSQAHFHGANLTLADLSYSCVLGADFSEALLDGASLQHSNLSGANLRSTNLANANFSEAYLLETQFQNASAVVCNFSNTYLRFAIFTGANLAGANFTQADLNLADLRGAKNLRIEQLLKTKTLAGAKLDEDIKSKLLELKPELLDYGVDEKNVKSSEQFWGSPLRLEIDISDNR